MMTDSCGASDVLSMMADLGRPITIDGVCVLGLVRRFTDEILPGEAARHRSLKVSVTIAKDSLPGLAINKAVRVDGDEMLVRDIEQLYNGDVTKFWCAVA